MGFIQSRSHNRVSCKSDIALMGLALIASVFVFLTAACSPPTPKLYGSARAYEDAKEMFGRGSFDRAAEFANGPASASPADAFTNRARVLRVVIFSGELSAYKDASDAYGKGVDKAKNTEVKGQLRGARHDFLQAGGERALALGETAQQLISGGALPSDLTLETPYPSREGPAEVPEFVRASQGAWPEPEKQDAALRDAIRKGIDDALGATLGGDRAKARAALAAGPVKLDSTDFALYLGEQALFAATLWDRKHNQDPPKFRQLCGAADAVAKIAADLVKANPNPDREKRLKKLQDQIKSTLKTG